MRRPALRRALPLQRCRAGRFRRAGKRLRHHADSRRRHSLRYDEFRPVGDGREPLREVAHTGREQSDGVERPGKALHTDRRQQPVARLDRSDTAERRRPDHRAGGLRAQRQRDHPGRDRRRRARRRSARRMRVIARIERRGRIVRGECRRGGLADDGRPRPPQRHHDRCVGTRTMSAVDRCTHLCREMRRIDDVLDSDGDPAQRPAVLCARGLVGADEGANGLVMRADCILRLGDCGVRRKRALLDPLLKVCK